MKKIEKKELEKAIANFSCTTDLVNEIREDYETGFLRWQRQDGVKWSECWSIEENTRNRIEVEPRFINCFLLDLDREGPACDQWYLLDEYEEINEEDVKDLPGWDKLLQDLFYNIAYTDEELEELKELYESGEI